MLESRNTIERIERLLDDFAMGVQGTLQISYVNVVVKIPTVSERRTQREPEFGVRIETLSFLQKKQINTSFI